MTSGRNLMVLNWEGFNQPGRYYAETMDLKDGKGRRLFHYYIPSTYDGSKPLPMLFDLHGGGSNGLAQWSSSRSDRLAEREGFIVVTPNLFPPEFVSAIIDRMKKAFNIDARRIYAMGVSMGGMGSSMLALQLSDKIAGIGVISGHMVFSRLAQNNQELPRPMPMIFFGGTKESTRGAPFRNIVPSMIETAKWLAAQNQCDPEPQITEIPGSPEFLDLDDLPVWTAKEDALAILKHYPTSVTRYVWSGGINGNEIVAYAVKGGGHVWPGGNQYVVETTVGPVTHLIDATQLTWEHLKKYTLPEK
jgi:polyhydroxybutyrate depolymerase